MSPNEIFSFVFACSTSFISLTPITTKLSAPHRMAGLNGAMFLESFHHHKNAALFSLVENKNGDCC